MTSSSRSRDPCAASSARPVGCATAQSCSRPPARTPTTRTPKILKRDYVGEIDDFAVYCQELGTVYLVPIADLPTRTAASLRVEAPRNNQHRKVRLAAQYEIARFDVY